ncbi:MAG: hypothetical protein ABI859_16645, partial [Pseudomonadota bacterium]
NWFEASYSIQLSYGRPVPCMVSRLPTQCETPDDEHAMALSLLIGAAATAPVSSVIAAEAQT